MQVLKSFKLDRQSTEFDLPPILEEIDTVQQCSDLPMIEIVLHRPCVTPRVLIWGIIWIVVSLLIIFEFIHKVMSGTFSIGLLAFGGWILMIYFVVKRDYQRVASRLFDGVEHWWTLHISQRFFGQLPQPYFEQHYCQLTPTQLIWQLGKQRYEIEWDRVLWIEYLGNSKYDYAKVMVELRQGHKPHHQLLIRQSNLPLNYRQIYQLITHYFSKAKT